MHDWERSEGCRKLIWGVECGGLTGWGGSHDADVSAPGTMTSPYQGTAVVFGAGATGEGVLIEGVSRCSGTALQEFRLNVGQVSINCRM